jgi:soluble lytic murein transglycosylase
VVWVDLNKPAFARIKKLVFLAVVFVLIILLLDNAARIYFPLKYRNYVVKYLEQYDLDPFLVFSVIRVESSFRPDAISPRNAKGLMQVSDKTGKWAANVLDIKDFEVDRLFEPELNIRIGCWYLKSLLQQFGRNEDTALAAYNAGSGNVSQWLQDSSLSRDGKLLDRIPFRETEKYLKRVKNSYSIYKKLYENNF